MKKLALSLLLLMVCTMAKAENKQSITTTSGGELTSLLTDRSVTDLTISGPLNGTDIVLLRTLAGTGALAYLDLKNARIVSGGKAYYESLQTQDDVVGEYMFKDLAKLRRLVLPDGIKRIDHAGVSNCGLLDSITVPDHVTELGWDALAQNSRLKLVRIGRGVQRMGQGTFWQDNALTDVYMYPYTPPIADRYLTTNTPCFHVYASSLNDYAEAWADRAQDYWKCTLKGDLVDRNYVDTDALMERLNLFFEDKACTELRSEFTSLSDAELAQKMQDSSIPESLIALAQKIKNDNWAKYEKQFRIHDYAAYSDAEKWHDILQSIGPSYMGNPTGICANYDDILYVFVDQDIPDGATLYLASTVDNGLITSAKAGTRLHKGLNAVVTSADQSLYYVLYTVDTSSMTKSVADWPMLSIHIEGGQVNGYYDSSHKSDVEFRYLLQNAVLPRFTVRGERGLFHFKTSTMKKAWPLTIDRSIGWFDDAVLWEYQLLGVDADVADGKMADDEVPLTGGDSYYPTYCNNPFYAIEGEEDDYGWANTTYYRVQFNGYNSVEQSLNIERVALDSWCAGHEFGHFNQQAVNMEYLTEITANIFAYHVLRKTGYQTSRGESVAYSSGDLLNHVPFVSRKGESNMRMYYQLYLYYHLAKHNPSFYPTLFKLLRKNPLKWNQSPNESYLHFVEACCEAAGEDLTDFFTLYGFFEPCSNPVTYDGEQTTFTITQAQIDATKSAIAKYPVKNSQIMFIEDRIKHEPRTDIWADGSDKVGYSDGAYGELGQYTDYMSDTPVAAEFKYYTEGSNTLIMEGLGAVGFALYDDSGNLIAAANGYDMQIPQGSDLGKCHLYAIAADGMKYSVDYAGEYDKTVTVKNIAGTLSQLLDADAVSVRISGELNGTDILYLREMIINHKLAHLDISACKIVAGGKAYYEGYYTSDNVIGDYMFVNCSRLRTLVLPSGATQLGHEAISHCSGLTSIAIPDNVTKLGWDALANNENLSTIYLGKEVTVIGQGMCWQSNSVTDVYMYASTPPDCAKYIFTCVPNVHVYGSSLSAYMSAWANRTQDYWDCILTGDLDSYTSVKSIRSETARPSKLLKNRHIIIQSGGKQFSISGRGCSQE